LFGEKLIKYVDIKFIENVEQQLNQLGLTFMYIYSETCLK